MPTNIAYLPLIQGADQVGDNEDWLSSIAFSTAGSGGGYPSAGNAGNATVGPVSVTNGAKIGDTSVVVTSMNDTTATFLVTDPDGARVGFGASGVPFQQGGLSFTIMPGSQASQAGDSFVIAVTAAPLDLTGITFAMQVRQTATAALVYADATTANGQLVNGGTTGVLGISVPQEAMTIPVGTYGFDIVATGDGISRRCVRASLTVVAGYTQNS